MSEQNSAFDLNLLRVFQALCEEGTVSRAAAKLGLTPSGVSHALSRLRDALGDPLFVPGPGGLRPTVRAEEIRPAFDDAIERIRGALAQTSFEPWASERTFRLAAGSMLTDHLAPSLVRNFAARGPGLRLSFWSSTPDLVDWLDDDLIDIALGGFEDYPKRLMAELLFEEELVWVARSGHPTAHQIRDIEDIVRLPRCGLQSGVGPTEKSGLRRDKGLQQRGKQISRLWSLGAHETTLPPPQVSVFDNISVLAIVEQTDLVALVPVAMTGSSLDKFDVRPLGRLPFAPTAAVYMLWHRSRADDPSHRWLRSTIRDTAAELSALTNRPPGRAARSP